MDFLKQWQGQRLLVTGASGFIGRRVLARAQQIDLELHAASRSGEAPEGIHGHSLDLRDPANVSALLTAVQPTVIFHLAAGGVAYGSGGMRALLEVNTLGLQALLEAASQLLAPPHIVIAGSGFEYAMQARPISEKDPLQPFSPYGLSKSTATMIADYYARTLPITILRLFSLYGIGERPPRLVPYIIQAAVEGEPILLTGCEQQRDYTFVDDVAEAFLRAGIKPPTSAALEVMNIATGQTVTLLDLVEELASTLTQRGFTPDLKIGAKPYRPEEPMVYVANVDHMVDGLGWQPRTSLRDGLQRTVEAWFEQS